MMTSFKTEQAMPIKHAHGVRKQFLLTLFSVLIFVACYLLVTALIPTKESAEGGSHQDLQTSQRILSLAESGQLSYLMELLAQSPMLQEIRDPDGNTILHKLVRNPSSPAEKRAAVSTLVDSGLDVNAQENLRGLTPLHVAVMTGESSFVRILLEEGADFRLRDDTGDTALQIAVQNNDEAVIAAFEDSEAVGMMPFRWNDDLNQARRMVWYILFRDFSWLALFIAAAVTWLVIQGQNKNWIPKVRRGIQRHP